MTTSGELSKRDLNFNRYLHGIDYIPPDSVPLYHMLLMRGIPNSFILHRSAVFTSSHRTYKSLVRYSPTINDTSQHSNSIRPEGTRTTVRRKLSCSSIIRGRTMSSSSPDFPPAEIREILNQVTSLLKDRNETISVAETAAGGLISSSILSTPGASKLYKGGLTLYTLPSRIAYAGWTQDTIQNYRGPTTDIVAGLAQHVRKDLESTYTLSESGTAGPTGGNTPNRTPGYVALAVDCEKGTFKKELNTELGGDRVANMVRFAVEAFTLLKEVIEGKAKL